MNKNQKKYVHLDVEQIKKKTGKKIYFSYLFSSNFSEHINSQMQKSSLSRLH